MNGIRHIVVLLASSFFLLQSNSARAVPPVQFGGPTNFVFGGSATAIASGDFNNDGKLDLVGAVSSSNVVNLLVGNGDGSFAAPVPFIVGSGPEALAVGDFNNDGNLDVIEANNFPTVSYTVLLGNGAGGFAITNFPFPAGFLRPAGIDLGDFNEDGNADFAVGGPGVLIYSGNGNGTFNLVTNFTNTYPDDVAIADLNHDNRPEVITANSYPGSMSVFSNLGSGLFAAPTNYSGGFSDYHRAVVTGDFNGDGHTDLATINQLNKSASVRLNNGDGTFGPDIQYPLGYGPYRLATSDLNGDGILDFLTIASGAPPSILLGNGDGTFGVAFTNFSIISASELTVGDFNNDGRPDLATAVLLGNALTIRLNQTPPSLHLSSVELLGASIQLTNPAPIGYAIGGNPRNVILNDFNGDGFPDLAMGDPFASRIAVRLNDGSNSFGMITNFTAGAGAAFVAAGDLNHDGKLDLVSANTESTSIGTNVSVLLGLGNGGFGSATNFLVTNSSKQVVIGDFNNDSNLDLAVGGTRVALLLGNGDGSFGAPSIVSTSDSFSLVAGDFNTDSNLDFVTMDGNFGLHFLWGNGDGTFNTNASKILGGGPMMVGDLNDDGHLDIAATKSSGVLILLGDGQGNFATSSIPASIISGYVLSPAVADLNSDNKLDLLVVAPNSTLTALIGVGDGTFIVQTNVISSPGATALVAGDLNKDAKPDVVAVTGSGTTMRRFLNITPPAAPQPPRIGGRLKLQWPAWPGSILEYSTNLSQTNGWIAVTNPPVNSGVGLVLTNLIQNENRYYRLRQP